MEKTFKILSAVFIGVAIVFLWFQNTDAVFVTAVIGAACFFLGIRYEIKTRQDRRDAKQRRARDQDT